MILPLLCLVLAIPTPTPPLTVREVGFRLEIGGVYEAHPRVDEEGVFRGVLVVGSGGAAVLDEQLRVAKQVRFQVPRGAGRTKFRATDLDGDGTEEFVLAEAEGKMAVALDSEGRELWSAVLPISTRGFNGIGWSLDLRGPDGAVQEVVFGSSGEPKAVCYNPATGEQRIVHWDSSNGRQSLRLDADGDGREDVVIRSGTDLIARSADGTVLWRHSFEDVGTYIGGVSAMAPEMFGGGVAAFAVAYTPKRRRDTDSMYVLAVGKDGSMTRHRGPETWAKLRTSGVAFRPRADGPQLACRVVLGPPRLWPGAATLEGSLVVRVSDLEGNELTVPPPPEVDALPPRWAAIPVGCVLLPFRTQDEPGVEKILVLVEGRGWVVEMKDAAPDGVDEP